MGAVLLLLSMVFMDNLSNRSWCVLCWNVRGLNSDARQRSVRSKVDESMASIICLQETKMQFFDSRSIKGFAPGILIHLLLALPLALLVVLWLFGIRLFCLAL